MEIQQAYDRVMKIMDEIQILQDAHIRSFDTELLPDMEKHCQERQHIFDRFYVESGVLIAHLETLQDKNIVESIVEHVNKRISGLLHQNDLLSQKTMEHRTRIQDSLNNLSRGKTAMDSYGTPAYIKNRPRAIYVTN